VQKTPKNEGFLHILCGLAVAKRADARTLAPPENPTADAYAPLSVQAFPDFESIGRATSIAFNACFFMVADGSTDI
jgi:hypothetical protein